MLLPRLTVLVYQDNFGKRFETAEWMAYSADYFTLNGYLVFAYDATGCDKSESDAVGGLPQGVIDLDFALHYVKETEEYRDRGDYRVVTKRQDVGDIREDSLIKKCQKRG